MRLKLLAVTVVVFCLVIAALLPRRGNVVTLPDSAFQNVQSVIVQDDWEGMSIFSPRVVHAQFQQHGEVWSGQVLMSVTCRTRQHGYWKDACAHETVAASVPDAVMRNVFRSLRHVLIRQGTYNAVQTHFADCPQPTLIFRSSTSPLIFRSESNTPHSVPWAVQKADGEFVTTSSAPDTALRLLRPFLHEGELHRIEVDMRDSRVMLAPRQVYAVSSSGAFDPTSGTSQ